MYCTLILVRELGDRQREILLDFSSFVYVFVSQKVRRHCLLLRINNWKLSHFGLSGCFRRRVPKGNLANNAAAFRCLLSLFYFLATLYSTLILHKSLNLIFTCSKNTVNHRQVYQNYDVISLIFYQQ